MTMRSNLLRSTMILGIVGLTAASISAAAFAQTAAPAPVEKATKAASTTEAAPVPETEELVVTGSRIRRTEFTSNSPIQVITAEQSTLEGQFHVGHRL
jgi:iron complex outermembrane receptor protein